MASTTRVTLTYADRYGKRAQVVLYFPAAVVSPTDASVLAVVALINAVLHSVCLHIEISKAAAIATTLGVGGYRTIQDKAIITLTDEENDAHVMKLPGPAVGVFGPDKRTVDIVGAPVVALSAAIVGTFTGRGGQDIVALTKGYRWTARRENKG